MIRALIRLRLESRALPSAILVVLGVQVVVVPVLLGLSRIDEDFVRLFAPKMYAILMSTVLFFVIVYRPLANASWSTRWTEHELSLPASQRDLYWSRALSCLLLIWVPALLGTLTAAAIVPLSIILGPIATTASGATLAIALVLGVEPNESRAPRGALIAGAAALLGFTAMPFWSVASWAAAPALAVAAAILWSGARRLEPTGRLSVGPARSPARTAWQPRSLRMMLFRALHSRWTLLMWAAASFQIMLSDPMLLISGLVIAMGFNLQRKVFQFGDALPFPRRTIFRMAALPPLGLLVLLALAAGFRTPALEDHEDVRYDYEWLGALDDDQHWRLQVPGHLWRFGWDPRESCVSVGADPCAFEATRFPLFGPLFHYNPYETPPNSSLALVALQMSRALEDSVPDGAAPSRAELEHALDRWFQSYSDDPKPFVPELKETTFDWIRTRFSPALLLGVLGWTLCMIVCTPRRAQLKLRKRLMTAIVVLMLPAAFAQGWILYTRNYVLWEAVAIAARRFAHALELPLPIVVALVVASFFYVERRFVRMEHPPVIEDRLMQRSWTA